MISSDECFDKRGLQSQCNGLLAICIKPVYEHQIKIPFEGCNKTLWLCRSFYCTHLYEPLKNPRPVFDICPLLHKLSHLPYNYNIRILFIISIFVKKALLPCQKFNLFRNKISLKPVNFRTNFTNPLTLLDPVWHHQKRPTSSMTMFVFFTSTMFFCYVHFCLKSLFGMSSSMPKTWIQFSTHSTRVHRE